VPKHRRSLPVATTDLFYLMELSKHNIISKVYQSDEYFIVNLLSGNADLLPADEARDVFNNKVISNPEYRNKGYVVDLIEEEKIFRRKYLDFLDARDADEVQLFYVPSYACNFSCSYCYQEGYLRPDTGENREIASAFFDYVQRSFAGRKKYITLFGGEPLLNNAHNRDFMSYFINRCRESALELAVVTNGYHLAEFVPLLSETRIREIQVTLDGPEQVHNARRPLKGGQGTFHKIVQGIDAALNAGLPINLRVVLDRDNISAFPELARFAIDWGWTASPLFKTQLGRNYELHFCQSQQSRLYSRIDLYRDLYDLILNHPHILKFHKPAYSISKFLFENGELPDPLFDSCPGCKTEWAFDYTGKVYSCTATVGKTSEELGSFFPEVSLDKDKVDLWQQRDVLSIQACYTCNLRLACGGGCASVAFNRQHQLHAPDCRPVKELLEMGIALYTTK
jgi:uncharacterized protein